MLKSSPNDKGLKPAKHEASNTTDNVQTSTKKQLKNEPSNTLEMVSPMEKELKELGPKPENQDESPKEKKLNLVGKILEIKECFQLDSHGLDLNPIGKIHENVANLDNDETTKSTSELGIGKGIKNGGSNAR